MSLSRTARFAVRAAAQARVVGSAASVHTVTTVETEPEEHKFDYTPEEHKWDPQGREARFPKTVSVPEGGPRVSFPDYPSIMRHSLNEPGYGSFGHSLREPAYEFVPKRHLSSNRAPPSRRRRSAPEPAGDDGVSEFAQSEPRWRLL